MQEIRRYRQYSIHFSDPMLQVGSGALTAKPWIGHLQLCFEALLMRELSIETKLLGGSKQ